MAATLVMLAVCALAATDAGAQQVWGVQDGSGQRPAVAFDSAHGTLPFPVQGKRVMRFGEATSYGSTSRGVVVEAAPGPVISPSDGWVAHAGEFRSDGQLLIVDAGDGYSVRLAGMSEIDVQVGQFVRTGERVGRMPPPKGDVALGPVLYIEFRKDGRAIDPDPWWRNR
jgi:septal ring factor EnvC (AmiA/AmiB activator)